MIAKIKKFKVLPKFMKKPNLTAHTYKASFLLAASLFLSGCMSLPPTSDQTADKRTKTETSSYASKQVITPKHPSYEYYRSKKAPDVTSEESHRTDMTRDFQPNIWTEMQHQFHLSAQHLGQYNNHINRFRKNPSHLKIISQRAKPYLHYILTQVQLRNMPYEIALLPIIESGFRPKARSSQQAGGLWQFIPSTADIFGLDQNWWYDGRQDVIQSTNAALDYLQKLYKRNNNDWLLALASYNAGHGTIRKATKKYKIKLSHPKSSPSFWDIQPYLPKETQNYVPQLLAVSHVINHIENFNIELEPIENSPFFTEIKLTKQMDLSKAMELSQVSKETFEQLNPAYLAPVTPPNGPFNILLPIEQANSFQQVVASNSDLFDIQWHRHKIRSGDSLSVIAKKYRTTQKAIKKINNMRTARLRAGKTLLIPVPSELTPNRIASDSNKIRNLAQNKNQYTKTVHKVKSGESLWSIARQYNINTRNLANWNQLDIKRPLRLGQALEIRNPNFGHAVQVKVKKGHSLWTIARQYNVTTKELAHWNNIKPSKVLQPGHLLTIWQAESTTNSKAKSQNKLPSKHARYKVKAGDNLWKIAQKNRVSAKELASYNNLSIKAYLKPGQVLKIPIRG